jgi:chromosome partitioning protein
MRTKVITINNRKGGVGKTSITLGVGTTLAKLGYRTVLVDLESQNNLTTGCLSPDSFDETRPILFDTLYAVAMNKKESHWYYSVPCLPVANNLHIIPSSRRMAGIENILAMSSDPLLTIPCIMNCLHNKFDYVLLDCPPTAGLITLSAYFASDYIYVPALLEDDSLAGAVAVAKDIKSYINKRRPGMRISGIILNQYNLRALLRQSVRKNFDKYFPGLVMDTVIHQSIAVGEAKRARKGIVEYAPRSTVADDFTRLTQEMLEKQEREYFI